MRARSGSAGGRLAGPVTRLRRASTSGRDTAGVGDGAGAGGGAGASGPAAGPGSPGPQRSAAMRISAGGSAGIPFGAAPGAAGPRREEKTGAAMWLAAARTGAPPRGIAAPCAAAPAARTASAPNDASAGEAASLAGRGAATRATGAKPWEIAKASASASVSCAVTATTQLPSGASNQSKASASTA